MPQELHLAPDVHAAMIERDLVLLDLAADAYTCLPDARDVLRLNPAARTLAVREATVRESLRAARLAQTAPAPPRIASAAAPPPARSALRRAYEPPRPSDAVPITRAALDALGGYARRPLVRILTQARRRGAGRPCDPSERMRDRVDRFHRWIPYAPVSGKCLLRSYLLLRALHRDGLGALWVFGVRTWPFSAHCWLQCGDLVLDDHADRVQGYTPILVV